VQPEPQRCHLYEKVGDGPDQLPGLAVRVWPLTGEPEIVGGDVLLGPGLGAVAPDWATTAIANRAVMVAAMRRRILIPSCYGAVADDEIPRGRENAGRTAKPARSEAMQGLQDGDD